MQSFDQKERDMSLEEISAYLHDVRGTRCEWWRTTIRSFMQHGAAVMQIFFNMWKLKTIYFMCENGLLEYAREIQKKRSEMR